MSRFLHFDLGIRSRGDIVEVELSAAANVRLLDSPNFRNYQRRAKHRYHGGLSRRSPVRLAVPRSGRWHVVVDMQGLRGNVRASVNIRPEESLRPLPAMPSARPDLVQIARNLEEADERRLDDDAVTYDVFISHAHEDKLDFVRPLADALARRDLRVWYDEFELRIGDSLRRRIDHGISRSRFGLVVLSPSFLRKSWPQYELDGLVTMSMSERQVILPIWHQVSREDVVSVSPSLADKVALDTGEYSVDEIADEIGRAVRPGTSPEDHA